VNRPESDISCARMIYLSKLVLAEHGTNVASYDGSKATSATKFVGGSIPSIAFLMVSQVPAR
jgi:hypothetical protein